MWLDAQLSPVYLKIVDLVVSPNVSDQQSLMYLSPLIALLLSCARTKKQLAEIECVLVCPVQMMEYVQCLFVARILLLCFPHTNAVHRDL